MLQWTIARRLSSVLLLVLSASDSYAEMFVPPFSGALYIKCLGGSAGATSDFGTGTSKANWVPHLRGLPTACPTTEILVGNVTAGQPVPFAVHTLWEKKEHWAFSTSKDKASVVAFSDGKNALRQGGRIIEQTSPNTWVMHLDDAASHRVDDNNADFLIQVRIARLPGNPLELITETSLSFPTLGESNTTLPQRQSWRRELVPGIPLSAPAETVPGAISPETGNPK